MRKRQKSTRIIGWAAITAGIVVLLSMILPAGFWWFMLGVALISAGICVNRWC